MRIFVMMLLLALAACAPQASEPVPQAVAAADPATPAASAPAEPALPAPDVARRPPQELLKVDGVDYSCRSDADCSVKDVGNCCGAYPACVNKDSPTFPDQVKARCAAEGMSSICGFREISSCQCLEGRCAPLGDGSAGGDVR
jgi:hypothetical protein